MADLMQASREWATRPADERFETIQDLWMACRVSAEHATAQDIPISRLAITIEQDGSDSKHSDIRLRTPQDSLKFNNWSFQQFARRVGSPGDYIETLPSQIAADALNFNIQKAGKLDAQVFFDRQNGIVRSVTTPTYGRVFNHEIVRHLIELPGKWVTPPARPVNAHQPGSRIATAEDVANYGAHGHPDIGVKVGDWIAPAGLYASDRDMFAFLIDPTARIDDGTDNGLGRGFFARNSEVGNGTVMELITFYYRYICGNHIVWDACNVNIMKVKHSGRGARVRAFHNIQTELKAYAEKSTTEDVARIASAKRTELGSNKDEVVELVFEKKGLLPRKKVEEAYLAAEEHSDTDGSPRSVWGFVQGLTRISQLSRYADERTKLDRAAGEILALAA